MLQDGSQGCRRYSIYYIFLPILSGLIEISVYSCGELRKAGSERKIDMKKLAIILAIVIMLFATQEQRAEQPPMMVVGASQNVVAEQTEKTPETYNDRLEKTTESAYERIKTESEVVTKVGPAVQTPMKECAEETEWKKDSEPEETVECVDKGNQSLVKYKQQPSCQTNPFENAPPVEIVDHPVEDLIGESEDRPGEGEHF